MNTQPIATEVVSSDFGPYCARCFGPVTLDKIERGPRIGVRLTWRHVERHPACRKPAA